MKTTDIFKACKDYLLECLWYFVVNPAKNYLIEIKKVWDFNFDCEDQSDEKFYSSATHFNFTYGSRVSIERS